MKNKVDDKTSDIKHLISDRQRKIEIIAVALTGLGKFAFMDILQWKLHFILVATVVWMAYVIYQSRRVDGIFKYWGFRTDNFKKVSLSILPFGIIFVLIFFIVGYCRGSVNLSWHLIPILILYPAWGVIQQFLVIGLVGGNLQDMKKTKFNKFVIIILTAVLLDFYITHIFGWCWELFVLALLYGFIYLKNRNVYVMGLFHGGLGALFFYTVVGRDPFEELFGKLLN